MQANQEARKEKAMLFLYGFFNVLLNLSKSCRCGKKAVSHLALSRRRETFSTKISVKMDLWHYIEIPFNFICVIQIKFDKNPYFTIKYSLEGRFYFVFY